MACGIGLTRGALRSLGLVGKNNTLTFQLLHRPPVVTKFIEDRPAVLSHQGRRVCPPLGKIAQIHRWTDEFHPPSLPGFRTSVLILLHGMTSCRPDSQRLSSKARGMPEIW